MATARASTNYTNYDTNHYIPVPLVQGALPVTMTRQVTIASIAAADDTYQLFTLKAGWSIFMLFATSNGLSASAAVGCTAQIGDSGDDDRFMAITDFDAANQYGVLAAAGANYTATTDTIVLLKIATAAAVVGQVITVKCLLIPG